MVFLRFAATFAHLSGVMLNSCGSCYRHHRTRLMLHRIRAKYAVLLTIPHWAPSGYRCNYKSRYPGIHGIFEALKLARIFEGTGYERPHMDLELTVCQNDFR